MKLYSKAKHCGQPTHSVCTANIVCSTDCTLALSISHFLSFFLSHMHTHTPTQTSIRIAQSAHTNSVFMQERERECVYIRKKEKEKMYISVWILCLCMCREVVSKTMRLCQLCVLFSDVYCVVLFDRWMDSLLYIRTLYINRTHTNTDIFTTLKKKILCTKRFTVLFHIYSMEYNNTYTWKCNENIFFHSSFSTVKIF